MDHRPSTVRSGYHRISHHTSKGKAIDTQIKALVDRTPVLIIGAGPAGASAAVFLGMYGIQTVMISRHSGTANTPRAHITNQRTMEALRDAGLEEACLAHASPAESIQHSFWLRTMAGEELARTYAWGNDPKRLGDYAAASPCRMCDLPQTELEPVLIAEARRLGCDIRFHTELVSFKQDDDHVVAQVVDRRSGQTTQVYARYMIGADGARSRVVEHRWKSKTSIPATRLVSPEAVGRPHAAEPGP